jgi:anti-repressor protein
MTNIQIFNNPKFGEIRTREENGNILFCGSDVAKALGYDQPHKAVERHCRKDGGMFRTVTDSLGREQQAKFISEGDLYRLVANSKLPSAQEFEAWIFDEVLPSIRKHGAYMTPERLEHVLLNPDTLIQLAQNLKNEQEKRLAAERQIEMDKPKVIFASALEVSNNSILVGELAKLLKQNGIDLGQNRLFSWLRDNGYLCKGGENYNLPSQYSMELGLFEIKKSTVNNPDGSVRVTRTPKVTGKGQIYFVNKLANGLEANLERRDHENADKKASIC